MLYIVLLLTYTAIAGALPSFPTTKITGCEYNGKWYAAGKEFKPSSCMFCNCVEGRKDPICAIADCAPPSCVDAVHKADQCCEDCPNGKNCWYGNQIISAGVDHHIALGSVCRCDMSWSHMFGVNGRQAVCTATPSTSVKTVI